MRSRFTEKQGQYLVFIYYYTKVNGRPPAEADMQRYFSSHATVVHQMVLTMEANGCFIDRCLCRARGDQSVLRSHASSCRTSSRTPQVQQSDHSERSATQSPP